MPFTHKVIIPATPSTVVSGRVDYSIGRVLDTRAKDTVDQRRRRFYSPLLLAEALCVNFALAQLVVYLGSLRHMKRVLGCFWEPKIDAGENGDESDQHGRQ